MEHKERRNARCRMNRVVIAELREGQPVGLVILLPVAKQPQVLFDFLVDVFRLAIGLWVIGCRGIHFDAQQVVKARHESSHKLCSAVADNDLWQPEVLPNVIPEFQSHPFSCDALRYR